MDAFVLHPSLKNTVQRYGERPVQALLLAGAEGLGKSTIAGLMVAAALHIAYQKLSTSPQIAIIQPENGSIGIHNIREVQQFLHLKTVGQGEYRRAVIVEQADLLTPEAQNAFLKVLEEPPADTLIVLTASQPRKLLPTIRSRLQTTVAQPPLETDLMRYFKSQGHPDAAIAQAYSLSGGLPGLMHALLADKTDHPLTGAVRTAKTLLTQTTFERLATIDALSKQKEAAIALTQAVARIAQVGTRQASVKSDTIRLARWHSIRTAAVDAEHALKKNANTKLVLTNFCLSL